MIGESVLSKESLSTAYKLRDRVSDREKFFITANYNRALTGDLEKAQQICQLWAQTYPREATPHSLLSGFLYQGAGKYERAQEEAEQAIALDPDLPFAYANLAFNYFYLGRPTEAENTARRASERKLDMPEFRQLRYYLAFLKDDQPGMEREVAQAEGKPGAEDWMSHSQSLVLARSGKVQLAGRISGRAIELALRGGRRERAAIYQTASAVREALFGDAAAAKRSAMKALEFSRGRDVEYGVAFALGHAGDISGAESLANDLKDRFPEDTSVRFTYEPTLRALVALNRGESGNVPELLRPSDAYEQAIPGITFFGFFGGLYPAYVRGEAFLAMHRGEEAAVEFQKLIDHPGVVFSDPIGAIARLQLARSYALSGDRVKAKTAYRDFLALWRAADPEASLLLQARAEIAKLG